MRAGVALAILIATCGSAGAETGPVIIIPGRAGVPIIMNGRDVSYAVIDGDWGLGKGQHLQPTIYGGQPIDPVPRVGHYYPSAGLQPGYGRLEIEPPEKPGGPQPAESYHQSWKSESEQQPVQPVQPAVPFYPPPVIAVPPNIMRPESTPPRQPNFRKPRN